MSNDPLRYQMTNKRVLVTGSDTGIGRGVAIEFARAGAAVAFHYAHHINGATAAVDAIRRKGGKAQAFHADFSDVEQAQRLVDEAIQFLGGLDVLVNNAGITMNLPFEEVTAQQFDTLYNVNVRGMYFVTQRAVQPMIAQNTGGTVINLTSVHALAGMTEHTVYAGTKAAIMAFTRVLALELAPRKIRVNAIAPGWILVENHYETVANLDTATSAKTIPAGFLGDPRDIAKLALFLASDDSRYIVGQTLVIDGGQLAIMPLSGDFRQPRTDRFGKGYVPGL
ncbi:MAG: glucose 1-dehydrogenase [Phycisphaerales bacterium]|jgi:3-oxoacyl-[acyl-carrier protein] reductase|nr:glucose 1-dehydrogenase [Phycisphaerales bacterium]